MGLLGNSVNHTPKNNLTTLMAFFVVLALMGGCLESERPLIEDGDPINLPSSFIAISMNASKVTMYKKMPGNRFVSGKKEIKFKEIQRRTDSRDIEYIVQQSPEFGSDKYTYMKAILSQDPDTAVPILKMWTIQKWNHAEVVEFLSKIEGFVVEEHLKDRGHLLIDKFEDLQAIMEDDWNFPSLRKEDYKTEKFEIYDESAPTSMEELNRKYTLSDSNTIGSINSEEHQRIISIQMHLGAMYYTGTNTPEDKAKARKWWSKAAAQGDAEGQFILGSLYAEGLGGPQDYAKARDWWSKAATQGHAKAQFALGSLYAEGLGGPQDYAKARDWFMKAAVQGETSVQEWLLEAAAEGEALAQYVLGRLYAKGQGIPQDFGQARHWYGKAAAQGDAAAQFSLGRLYAMGQGGPQDFDQARDWWRKAAEQGDVSAQFTLGRLYAKGQGGPQDYGKAREWWNKAATQGHAQAQFELGSLFYRGQDGLKDTDQATKLWGKALAQDDAEAKRSLRLFMLGLYNELEKGVDDDVGVLPKSSR